MFFMLLTVAGNETTRNAITHGMLAFLEHPDQWDAAARRTPSCVDTAVEEIVRWASPVIYFRRSVTHDTELRGQQMKAGDKITVWYPSANRDEDVFERPVRLRRRPRLPTRTSASVAAARTSASARTSPGWRSSAIYDELARPHARHRVRRRAADRLRSNFINGIKRIPVTYTPSKPVLT